MKLLNTKVSFSLRTNVHSKEYNDYVLPIMPTDVTIKIYKSNQDSISFLWDTHSVKHYPKKYLFNSPKITEILIIVYRKYLINRVKKSSALSYIKKVIKHALHCN